MFYILFLQSFSGYSTTFHIQIFMMALWPPQIVAQHRQSTDLCISVSDGGTGRRQKHLLGGGAKRNFRREKQKIHRRLKSVFAVYGKLPGEISSLTVHVL